jgi:hypothetical protein
MYLPAKLALHPGQACALFASKENCPGRYKPMPYNSYQSNFQSFKMNWVGKQYLKTQGKYS